MRRIIVWLSTTAVAVTLLVGYQFAGNAGDGKGGDRACPTATVTTASQAPEETHCEPAGGDRTGGDTGTHVDKPGENK